MYTELGQLIGTPEYMSPEQADLTVEDVDTRTDVYSLGVVLYQLLVGALPFDSGEMRRAGLDGVRQLLREHEPARPSTRLATLGEASVAAAANRRTEPPALARQLTGDLDWITMKALDKDRSRRYGSPHELAADLGRYLRNEPVEARPPTTAYRMAQVHPPPPHRGERRFDPRRPAGRLRGGDGGAGPPHRPASATRRRARWPRRRR